MSLVDTTCGKVEGRQSGGVAAFLGIPFAAPPVGPLRFREPAPAAPWGGVRPAVDFGPFCQQIVDPVQTEIWALEGDSGEDCLTLNVWTPGADTKRRPVMVWIHGGAFRVGAARRNVSRGERLAARGDVVVVTLNYRLHAFGFLDLSELGGAEYASSGNLGLLDQIAALRWVQANIERFGGDPENVTLFGESAGGISVGSLLGSPHATGLFHRAVSQSGTANLVRTPEQARAITRAFAKVAKVETVEELRALSADELVGVAAEELSPTADLAYGPVADGDVVAGDALSATATGPNAHVPVLHGTNRDEYRYWYMEDPRLSTLRPEHLRRAIDGEGGAHESVVDAYRKSRPQLSENEVAVGLIGEMAFRMPHVRMSEHRAAAGRKTWMYLFTRESPVQDGRLGAAHAMDIPFVFDTLEVPNVPRLIGDAPELSRLRDAMQGSWLAFARTGDPNHSGLPEWPAYELDGRATMLFDIESRIEHDPFADERRSWGDARFGA
jgi:para-nitrobenzyl esterase